MIPVHHPLPFGWHLSISHLIFSTTLRSVSSVLQMRMPRSAQPLSKVRVKDKVSRFNPATVHSWMCYFTRLGPMMDVQTLFREVGERAFILTT